MSKWIRKGDKVIVVAGNSKGKTGEVLSRKDDRVIIQDVNMRKKHLKKTQEAPGGRIIEMEMPLHISNVRLCDKEGNPLKVRNRTNQEGLRELVYGKTGTETVYRSVKKG
ncbi:MAG TPA: 50S ribosomal protein L24 [Chlamydiales bacterium]|nr:50S ribosomal protein L24 [Chlamydiales bacterium]